MPDDGIDKRRAAIDMRVSLADVPVLMDILVTTSAELNRRGSVLGSVFQPALAEGRILYACS